MYKAGITVMLFEVVEAEWSTPAKVAFVADMPSSLLTNCIFSFCRLAILIMNPEPGFSNIL